MGASNARCRTPSELAYRRIPRFDVEAIRLRARPRYVPGTASRFGCLYEGVEADRVLAWNGKGFHDVDQYVPRLPALPFYWETLAPMRALWRAYMEP